MPSHTVNERHKKRVRRIRKIVRSGRKDAGLRRVGTRNSKHNSAHA